MALRALLFDVYGTLLDVHGLVPALEALAPGRGEALSALWRSRQIDYTRLRTLSGRHRDFLGVTGDALDYAMAASGIALPPEARERLLAAYLSLPPHEDARPALEALAARGIPLGVLSNGTPLMLERALGAAGLAGLFAHRLSIEAAGQYKTAPAAYALGTAALGLAAGEIGFVSSNGWDVAGAAWFGYRAFWVNRAEAPPERLGVCAEAEGRTLRDLVHWAGTAL